MAEMKEILDYQHCGSSIENFEKMANAYVQKHKFPSFDEMDNEMIGILEKSVLHQKTLFSMYAEFGPTTYTSMKAIYENPTNGVNVKNIGKSLNEQGGFNTMHAAYYLMCNFTTIREYEYKRCWLSIVNFWWDGVGEWIGK